jgi:serine/threonine protein phosphatase PrpC
MGTLLDKPVTEKENTAEGVANELPYGVAGMQGWRVDMEDSHLCSENLDVGVEDHSLFGVFDGHGGSFAAIYAARELRNVLLAQPLFLEYKALAAGPDRATEAALDLLKEALRLSFLQVDDDMRKTEEIADRRDRSGCTAIVVMVTPTHLVCANSGDSRSVYCTTAGETVPLSFDHKPYHTAEQQRIDKAGGYVSMKRVDGDLAVSRALGDFQYKDRPDLPAEEQKVTANPDFVVRERVEGDEFLLIACDGIWDVCENPDAVAMINKILQEGEKSALKIAEEVLDECLEKGSRDNMTACVVLMKGAKFGEGGGVLERRAKREAEAKAKEDAENANASGGGE